MMQVLTIELDPTLRGTLRDLLSDAGYGVIDETTTIDAALAYLSRSPQRMLVIVSNVDYDHHLTARFFADVVANKRLRTRYRYILLSTAPSRIPPELTAHLDELHAAILPKPFELDAVLSAVDEAAARLIPVSSRVSTQSRLADIQ